MQTGMELHLILSQLTARVTDATLLCSVVGAVSLAYVLVNLLRLRSVPGPFIAKFTDLWFSYHVARGNPGLMLLNLHKHHGPLIRIGPNRVSLGDPAGIPVLYRTSPIQAKGGFYKFGIDFSNPENMSIGNAVDEKLHSTLKRPIAPLFSMATTVELEAKLDEKLDVLLEYLRHKGSVDIRSWASYWSIDSLNHVAFSEDLGYMRNEKDVGDVLAMSKSISMDMQWFYIMPWLKQLQMVLSRLLAKDMLANNPLVPLAVTRVTNRLNTAQQQQQQQKKQDKAEPFTAKKQPDFLDRLIQVSQMHPNIYGLPRLISSTLLLIFAGSDSTAATMTFILYYLVKNPRVLRKLETEVETARQEGRLTDTPQWVDVSKLNYLSAVIKESLRLSCIVQHGMDREIAAGGLDLCGHHLPAGTTVTAWQQTIHYNEQLYGCDSRQFRPERWLEVSPQQRQVMEHSAIWFGHGKHVCSGQHLSRVNMSKLLARLVLCFHISDTNPGAELDAIKISALGFADREYFLNFKAKGDVKTGS